jgi:hypothetical protein
MSDTEAMNEIAEILRAPECVHCCLDYIAEVVRATGRDFPTPEGDE